MTRHSILFLSHSNVFEHFKVGSHHYAAELARRGHDVFHVSTPISLIHRILGRAGSASIDAVKRGWMTDENNVHHLVPSSIIPAGLVAGTANRIIRSLPEGQFDLTFVDQPLLWSSEVRTASRTLVYRPTDIYDEGRKRRLQDEAIAQADGVVATSDEVLRRLGLSESRPSLVLPNGVDLRNFAVQTGTRRDVAVYVGALDSRFEWNDVRFLADCFPLWRFEIYGPTGNEPADLPANIQLKGAVDYDDLNAVFSASRIGLLPLTDVPVNAGRSPMKLYEYLAGGLGVLSTSTPTIQENDAVGLLTYTSQDELHTKFAMLAVAAPNPAGKSLAVANSWDAKADQLLRFAESL
ncbi:glycosyltransferase [Labedella phragmitis]|uniref:Glycosyltransferase n=1 Tax=Labedella phragmitis TaxID=2498849 RepID=A0A3S3ZI43_9MICO|nr:glycosyltransferase [Labedella phragmitis]RWZ46604.1 glycosyltransferase [Labedella phragmitis]